MNTRPESLYSDDDLRVIVQDWDESDAGSDQCVAVRLARELLQYRSYTPTRAQLATGPYVDRIIRIFSDKPYDDTSALVLKDYAEAVLAAEALRQSQSLPAGAVAGLVGKWRRKSHVLRDLGERRQVTDMLVDCADELEQALQADAREKGEAITKSMVEAALMADLPNGGKVCDYVRIPMHDSLDDVMRTALIAAIGHIGRLPSKWRSENGDYPESKDDCAAELDEALATQPAQASEKDIYVCGYCAEEYAGSNNHSCPARFYAELYEQVTERLVVDDAMVTRATEAHADYEVANFKRSRPSGEFYRHTRAAMREALIAALAPSGQENGNG